MLGKNCRFLQGGFWGGRGSRNGGQYGFGGFSKETRTGVDRRERVDKCYSRCLVADDRIRLMVIIITFHDMP